MAVPGPASDPLPEALTLARRAAEAGVPLKLFGGLAVRVICPDLPPRPSGGQDIDFACLSRRRKEASQYLEEHGCVPDRRFNSLNGHQQMFFTAPSGRPIDIVVDQLRMCHTLDFRSSFDQLPVTLGAADLLLSKLQIVELNEKDVHDVVQLLATVPVGGDASPSFDVDRYCRLLSRDWGWWRTVTANLARIPGLLAERPELAPPEVPLDPIEQSRRLLELAESAPKSMKWRVRAGVGDRVRWYELPEEVDHRP